jgi:hypothetical protein
MNLSAVLCIWLIEAGYWPTDHISVYNTRTISDLGRVKFAGFNPDHLHNSSRCFRCNSLCSTDIEITRLTISDSCPERTRLMLEWRKLKRTVPK